MGAVPFTVGDTETAAGSLTVSGTSSNTTLVPNGNIVFGGSGANRTVTVTPAANQNGSANITVTVSDGSLSTPTSFQLTVNAVNDAPTITGIANQTTTAGTAVGPLNFTVGDVETAVGSLTVSGSSNNLTLVPNGNISVWRSRCQSHCDGHSRGWADRDSDDHGDGERRVVEHAHKLSIDGSRRQHGADDFGYWGSGNERGHGDGRD